MYIHICCIYSTVCLIQALLIQTVSMVPVKPMVLQFTLKTNS